MTDNDRPRGVYLAPEPVQAPEKASQTLLNKISDCPYSGYLYLRHHDDGIQSHAMARGEAIHEAIELLTNMAIESGEVAIPPEVAKDHMQAVLDERTDLAMSPAEHEACRIAAWNWATDTRLDPSVIVGVEMMLETEIAGWKIRGKVDRLEIVDRSMIVRDYKTGLYYPDAEAFENDFQMQFYGLLGLEGVPEDETVPIGRGLEGVEIVGEYPRIKRGDGPYFKRNAYKDRGQIHDFRRTVESALAKLDHGLETGEWKATPGDWCGICPARPECPIPADRLPTDVATEGQATEVAGRILLLEEELGDLRKPLKFYVEDQSAVIVGDQEFDVRPSETDRMVDREALYAAMRDAGLEPADFFTTSRSMRFSHKKIR